MCINAKCEVPTSVGRLGESVLTQPTGGI